MTNAPTLADLQKAAASYADTLALLTLPQKYTTYALEWERAGSQAITLHCLCARFTIGLGTTLFTLWAEKPGSDTTALPNWNYWRW